MNNLPIEQEMERQIAEYQQWEASRPLRMFAYGIAVGVAFGLVVVGLVWDVLR